MTLTVARTVVYMLVRNACTHDARVLKEADALARRGLRVTIIAVQRDGAPPLEQRGAVTILRVPIRPWHYRILRRYRSLPRLQTLFARRRRRRRIMEARSARRRAARARAKRLEQARQDRERALHRQIHSRGRRSFGAPASTLDRRRSALAHHTGATANIAAVTVRARELRARAFLTAEHRKRAMGVPASEHLPTEVADGILAARGRAGLAVARSAAWLRTMVPHVPAPRGRRMTADLAKISASARAGLSRAAAALRPVRSALGRGAARARAGARAATRPLGRLRSRIRPALYEGLRWTLMRAHRQFLLADYSSRALKAIDSDLARVTERRERGTVVIHAHDLNTLVPGARAKARFGARLVYDSHELQLGTTGMMSRSRPHRWLYKIYERSLARRADAVITVCESIAEILERGYGIPHVDVVRNCPLLVPPLDRHDLFRREQGIPPQQKIALYHGNLSPGRGLEVLVQSAQFMPETHVVLLGSGPLFDELPKIAEHYGVSETVHVLPAVRQTVLHRYVASADVAVVPIQGAIPNYYYSLPNKLFEALMAGLPIAASHLPEIRRVVEDERVGAIFDPDDPQDVARGITDVLTAADYQAMRERAVVAARERHHWGREVERLSAVYDRLAATA